MRPPASSGGRVEERGSRRRGGFPSSLLPPLSLSLSLSSHYLGGNIRGLKKKKKKQKTHPSPSVSRLSVSFFVFHHPRVSAGSYHNTTRSAVSLAPDTQAPRHFLLRRHSFFETRRAALSKYWR